jgi:uncharacterized protein YabE (DUF348 family)
VRRSFKWAIYVLVLGGIVAGTLAWLRVDKSVTLEVDGKSRTVYTVSDRVSGALRAADISIGSHDVVAPPPDSRISNGDKIVVRLGRLLHLVVDGSPRDVWVTAPTVQQALSDLGYVQGSYSSVSRDKRLPVQPTNIDVRTPKSITVVVDGQSIPVTTTSATLAEVLTEAGVTVGPDDIWSAPADSAPTDGMTVTIQRVTLSQETDQEPIPFDTQSSNDSTLVKGQVAIDTPGVNGTASVVYQITTIDGVPASKTPISQTVVTPPVTQVQRVGTLDNTPAGAQAIAQQMALSQYSWGSDQFSCLVSLWSKESGWRVAAANPSGAYGIPQALPGSKMASFGSDWQTNPATQIAWGLSYIKGIYGTPCGAWSHSQSYNWY